MVAVVHRFDCIWKIQSTHMEAETETESQQIFPIEAGTKKVKNIHRNEK
jgi:hypothetical protein